MNDAAIRCAIKEYRLKKKLSQDELARLVGVRRQAVYDMESGRYLPNTAVALRLARVLGCTVEMLFVETSPLTQPEGLHLLGGAETATARLSLARVRGKLVGIPLRGTPMPFMLEASDGFLVADNSIDCPLPHAQLENTILILGCDPALGVLGGLVSRAAPGLRAHTAFASSRRALLALGAGNAHVAGTHYHSSGTSDGNVEAVQTLSPGLNCLIIAFSMQEEGLMVAAGNRLGLRSAQDLTTAGTRFVNREEGAALRRLLDEQLARHGVPDSAVQGYATEVHSHCEGAMRVAAGAADAALGLRVVAESFGLDFVPLAATRCDLVIPADLRDHPGLTALLDVLQSSRLKKELCSLPGYDASNTGKIISGR